MQTRSDTATHCSWGALEEEQVNPGMHRKLISGQHIMISRMRFADGTVVLQHAHENEQITMVTSGKIRFLLGADKSEVVEVGPGEMLVIPPNLPHEAHMCGEVVETDVFSPPRQDWLDGSDSNLRQPQG